MTKRSVMHGGLCLAICLLLGACGGAVRIPEDSFYRLDKAEPATVLAAPVLHGTVMVQGGSAAPVYRDRAFHYSEAGNPTRLQRYHYHYWIDTPPQLLQRDLADYLRAANIAAQVVMPEDGVDADHLLRVDIERLEHLRGAGNGRVIVALNVTLRERASGRLKLQDNFKIETTVQSGDFSAVALAYRQALTGLYAELLARLRAQP